MILLLRLLLDNSKQLVSLRHLENRAKSPRWDYRAVIRLYISILFETQFLSEESMLALQTRRLARVLKSASKIPWWQNRLAISKTGSFEETSFRTLQALPVTKKSDLLTVDPDLLVASPQEPLLWRTTTGTDGVPFTWAQNMRTHFTEYAAYYLRSLKHFHFPVERYLNKKFFLMFNYPEIHKYYLAFFTNSINIPYRKPGEKNSDTSWTKERRCHIYERINQKPSVLYGAPSTLHYLLELAEEDHEALSPEIVVLSGEMAPPDLLSHFKQRFQCPVRSFYGTRELGTIGFSCSGGDNVFHLNSEHILLEVLNEEGRECKTTDEFGYLVMTSLSNTSMPLLRYRTGDMGRLVKKTCQCNTALPQFELIGRETEFVSLFGNRYPVWPLYSAIFAEGRFSRIRQYQIRQVAEDAITVFLVGKSVWTGADKKKLEGAIKEKVGSRFRVEVKFVETIEGQGRKHRPFIPFGF